MKKIFKIIPLNIKLFLIGLIPAFFVLYFALELQQEKKDKIDMVEKFVFQLKQSAKIITLIDQIQLERRFTFSFCLNGERQTEMLMQRKITDDALNSADEHEGNLITGYKRFTFLDSLTAFRKNVDAGVTGAEDATEYYTNVLNRLTSVANVASGNSEIFEPLINDLRAQRIVTEMISALGNLRNDYYLALYTKQDPKTFSGRIRGNYSLFRSLENELFIKSSAETKSVYAKVIGEEDVDRNFSVIRNYLLTGKYDTSVGPEEWWTVSASAIDAMKVLQRDLLQNVISMSDSIADEERASRRQNLILIVLLIALVLTIVLYTIRSISHSLNDLRTVSEKIALGISGHTFGREANDAIGSLSSSIQLIDQSNISLAHVANEIGRGNFGVQVAKRSEEDILGYALIKMKDDLERFTADNQLKLWIQEGISRVNEVLRGEKNVNEISSGVLSVLAEYLEIPVAAFFVSTSDTTLEFTAGFALSGYENVPKKISVGETQIGQAALNQTLLRLNKIPAKYLKINSGTLDAYPSDVIIVPLVFNRKTEGVIEIASLEGFGEQHLSLVSQISQPIATALQVAKNRTKLQELLEETQAQSEELQAQHSELENLNSELEAQAQKLQSSEEELKVQQEELLQANTELEERAQLLQEKNAEIQARAKELALTTKYKSEFLANMSHELRTPLNSILLLSRLLSDNNHKHLDDEEVEYAKVIQSSGTGLLNLINEILDLSKIETGKMELDFEDVSTKELANEIRALFTEVAKEKKIDFDILIADNAPAHIRTDKMRLGQIIKNLISNAIKFTSKGAVTFKIQICETKESALCFIVKDSGIGIPKDKQHLVFEAFQQADGSTKRKYGGTGLGLSISKQLAALLGGKIELKSEVNEGSEFSLVIPFNGEALHEKDEHDGLNPVEAEKSDESLTRYVSHSIPQSLDDDRNNYVKGDKTILIVEDDVNFAKSLIRFTRERGYKAISSVRGDEALDLAKTYSPRGILLDIQLPVKSGWEVMDELKKDLFTRHIPVHIMSSHHVKRQSLLKGAVDFIDKPLAIEQMKEVFERIEYVLSKNPKKVLIVEDNEKHAQALAYFLESNNIQSEIRSSVEESKAALKSKDVDCVILDMGIPDNNAHLLLEQLKADAELEKMPVIIFTGRNLSLSEEQKIRKYADAIVVKTAHSYQRMLDEVSLFLHVVEEKHNDGRQSFKNLGTLDNVLNGKTVLITDDDVRNIYSLSKALEKLNIKVVTAINGKEAIERLEENSTIDLVLLDMMMPEMDGYETAKQIRKNFKWKNLPVIAVTAKAMVGDREKCIQAGASDYISKPVDIDQLLSLLRVWLYNSKRS
jgi:signal transduction histidine kinase/DNA-binding response OmpR family regulator